MKDLPVERKLELVREALLGLSTLKVMKYTLANETKLESKLAGDSYDYDFRSSEGDREVNFHFSPFSERHGDLLGVIIESKPNGGHFALGDYLMARDRKTEAIEVRDSRRQSEDFSIWLNEKLKLIDGIFSNELRDILSGKTWEKVPMDFYGYK